MSRYQIGGAEVIPTLQKHILADGFHVVIDLERSHGSYIHDAVTGKEILDFYSYFASLPVGHNHPKLRGDKEFLAALERAALANPANSDIYTMEYGAFVERFAALARPEGLQYLFFVAGGALAVENALKVAFDWKVRKNRAAGRGEKGGQILHFKEAFHGRSGYTMSLTNTDPVKTDGFPKFDWPRVVNPKLQFPVDEAELRRVAEVEKEMVRQIEAAFAERKDEIAAIIIEPIQGEGGDNHFRAELFRSLRALADQHDALLIFDEVQTGGGITGELWCHQHFGVTPDILVFGKKCQVCGIMASKRVDEVPDNVFHTPGRINSTWGGNLVDMVRGLKYLEIIHEDKLVANAAKMGARFLAGLEQLRARHGDLVSNVRGRGLFTAFTLPSTAIRNTLRQACWDLGLATLTSGATSIRFRPGLDVCVPEIDRGLEILDRALERAHA
ncbi:MAG: L-lysine 6-transaminase [Acidobacteriota bacterium]|nr:L-lysine 6-transaminase [Acidobacteriota bacterium]